MSPREGGGGGGGDNSGGGGAGGGGGSEVDGDEESCVCSNCGMEAAAYSLMSCVACVQQVCRNCRYVCGIFALTHTHTLIHTCANI